MQTAQRDPVGWAERVLGVSLWGKQREILESVRDHTRTAVKSCNASGKTYDAAVAALWFLYSFPHGLVLTTAPTFRQVRDNTWAELQRLYHNARVPLGYQQASWANCRLVLDPKWRAIGFATDRMERFASFHAEHVLVIVDEASGVDQGIFDAIEGVQAGGAMVRRLLLSQGTQTTGAFHAAFHAERSLWSCLTIAAWDTPNFAPDVLAAWEAAGKPEQFPWPAPYLINPAWVESRKTAWGVGTPLWEVRVAGNFPPADPYAVISLADAEKAGTRASDPDTEAADGQIGVDVARTGMDLTVVYSRRGDSVLGVKTRAVTTGPDVEMMVLEMYRETGITTIVGDADGVGGPVLDYLRLHHPDWKVHDFHSMGRPRDVDTFENAKAEEWDRLAQRFRAGEISLASLPKDERDELVADLVMVRKEFSVRQRIKIEDKERLKQRHGRSPDRADALLLAFIAPGVSFGAWADYMRSKTPEQAAA